MVARAFSSAEVPAIKEHNGLTRVNGKRPAGLTLIRCKAGKPFTLWDVTVASTLAASYVEVTSRSAGTAAELAACMESAKCAIMEQSHIFQHLVFENVGSMNESFCVFNSNLGHTWHWRQVYYQAAFCRNPTLQCHFIYWSIDWFILIHNSSYKHKTQILKSKK